MWGRAHRRRKKRKTKKSTDTLKSRAWTPCGCEWQESGVARSTVSGVGRRACVRGGRRENANALARRYGCWRLRSAGGPGRRAPRTEKKSFSPRPFPPTGDPTRPRWRPGPSTSATPDGTGAEEGGRSGTTRGRFLLPRRERAVSPLSCGLAPPAPRAPTLARLFFLSSPTLTPSQQLTARHRAGATREDARRSMAAWLDDDDEAGAREDAVGGARPRERGCGIASAKERRRGGRERASEFFSPRKAATGTAQATAGPTRTHGTWLCRACPLRGKGWALSQGGGRHRRRRPAQPL